VVPAEPEWIIAECDEPAAARLSDELNIPAILGRLLALRGISTTDEARSFLDPALSSLHDPFLLPDLEPGVERLAKAVESGERIRIHGDYDVDGVTGTALLVRTLTKLNASVDHHLPHRRRDGYDIKPRAVEAASKDGVALVVTCDCGITACETVARANQLGVDVIVTDHHEPGETLPDALAVINPKREDACYPFPQLAGVGVAMKLAQGLVRRLGFKEESFLNRFIDLAALGTVGDVVPLLGENRIIVSKGLSAIETSKKVGLRTIVDHTNREGKPITAHYLGFVIGPRINAAGRMDDAGIALRLLLTSDESEARELIGRMERHNRERRAEQERILTEAKAQAESKYTQSTRVLVLAGSGWNSGVVGIVAGKICESYGRPAILLTLDSESGFAHGSARSLPSFSMIEGLRACSDLLGRFGGHELAAGVSLPLANLSEFEQRINEIAETVIPPEELVPAVEADAEIAPSEITMELACLLSRMEPFGPGNPEPLFVTRGVSVAEVKRVGDGSHLRMTIREQGRQPLTCIGFGLGDLASDIDVGTRVDLCHHVQINRFNGSESVQLVLEAVRPCRI